MRLDREEEVSVFQKRIHGLEGEKLFAVNQQQQVFSTLQKGASLCKNQLINSSHFPKVTGVVNGRAMIPAHIYLTPQPVFNLLRDIRMKKYIKSTCYFLVHI